MAPSCPCCNGTLVSALDQVRRSLGAAQDGDRVCPNCDWVLVRELLDDEAVQMVCPTHGLRVHMPGVGPGALSE